jgi:hypothetical protein
MSKVKSTISFVKKEFNKFLNAETDYFGRKELIERKERAVQLFLIIYGLILSQDWKSDLLSRLFPVLSIGFIAFILIYYAILPSRLVNDEFRTIADFCVLIIDVCFSSALIIVFSSFITVFSGSTLFTLGLMFIALLVLVLRLLYVGKPKSKPLDSTDV